MAARVARARPSVRPSPRLECLSVYMFARAGRAAPSSPKTSAPHHFPSSLCLVCLSVSSEGKPLLKAPILPSRKAEGECAVQKRTARGSEARAAPPLQSVRAVASDAPSERPPVLESGEEGGRRRSWGLKRKRRRTPLLALSKYLFPPPAPPSRGPLGERPLFPAGRRDCKGTSKKLGPKARGSPRDKQLCV